MKGIRVYPNADGWLDQHAIAQPGAYGRVDIAKVKAALDADGRTTDGDRPWMHWELTAPDGRGGRLDPKVHTVVEHEDGTITVTPSIDLSQRVPGAYHGHLTRGEWKP